MDYFSHLRNTEKISLGDAINLLVPIFVKLHKWNSDDKFPDVWLRKCEHIERVTVAQVRSGSLTGFIKYDEVIALDGFPKQNYDGSVVVELDYADSWVDFKQLLNNCCDSIETKYGNVPDDIKRLLPERFDELLADRLKDKDDVLDEKLKESSGGGEFADNKYPDFKGCKQDKMSKEEFASLKQHYGIVKKEEAKLRRLIPVAAKIGLLFYKRNLSVPINRPAFIKEYKAEFDSVINNNTLANLIFDSLPEEYKIGARLVENSSDLLLIIKAAVYAGSIYDTDDAKNIEKLKFELAENKYRLPSDDVLLDIIEAVKAI